MRANIELFINILCIYILLKLLHIVVMSNAMMIFEISFYIIITMYMVNTCPNNYKNKYISGHVYFVRSAHVPTTTKINIFQATCTLYGQHMSQQLQK